MNKSLNLTTTLLVLANLTPLLGFYFFNWSLEGFIITYLFETIIIVYFTSQKMKLSRMAERDSDDEKKLQELMTHINGTETILELIIAYRVAAGYFLAFYALFLFIFFKPQMTAGTWDGILISSILLFLSHYISFKVNYIGKKEYEKVTVQGLFLTSIERILPITIPALITASSPFLLIMFKTFVDVTLHIREHLKIANRVEK